MNPATARAVDALEADDRDQHPESYEPWTPAYRQHIARLLDGIMLTGNISRSRSEQWT